jgi:hypothetical protein
VAAEGTLTAGRPVTPVPDVEPGEPVLAQAPTCWRCSWTWYHGVFRLKGRSRLCSQHGSLLATGEPGKGKPARAESPWLVALESPRPQESP